MMRVFYGSLSGHAHRYQCKGDNDYNGTGLCIGVGGVRVDRAVASQFLEALPVAALDSQAVQAGVRAVKDRRPLNFKALQHVKTLRLSGL
jgi:hypothetical protein